MYKLVQVLVCTYVDASHSPKVTLMLIQSETKSTVTLQAIESQLVVDYYVSGC